MDGEESVKLAAGDLVLYSGTSVHRVIPVTRGTRLASFWLQSMVWLDFQRTILFKLDNSLQQLGSNVPEPSRAGGYDGRLSQSAAAMGRYLSLADRMRPLSLPPNRAANC